MSFLLPQMAITHFSPLLPRNRSIQLSRFSKVSLPTLSKGDTRDIEDEDSADGVLEVAGDEASISLLARSVPKLKPASGAIMRDVLAEEIDSDCGLD